MIAAIPAEDRPTIIEQRIPTHVLQAQALVQAIREAQSKRRICLSCGAKTDEGGALPCGH